MDNNYVITSLGKETEDTFVMQLKPSQGEIFSFLPGQFCQLQNPNYSTPGKSHLFSIASTPTNKKYLEFGFKIYGEWTKRLSDKVVGDMLTIRGPFGRFTWEETIQNAVFLAGGIGITPFMSMLRNIAESNQKPSITLIYCNRTEANIAFKKEIEGIMQLLSASKVVHVLSDVKKEDGWNGYRGFLTKEILEKEVNFDSYPTFFVCGPPVFVKLSKELLGFYHVDESRIKQELF